jgi:hypothetical protein
MGVKVRKKSFLTTTILREFYFVEDRYITSGGAGGQKFGNASMQENM